MTAPGGKRITLVVNTVDGASETFLRSLATVLADLGHTVTVHSTKPASGPAAFRPTVDSRGWTVTRAFPTSPTAVPFAAAELIRNHRDVVARVVRVAVARYGWTRRALVAALGTIGIVRSGPDIVHFGFSGIAVNMADSLDLLGVARTVVSCRGTGEQVRPVIDEQRSGDLARVLGRVDAIHAVSDALAATIVGLGAPADRITVVRPAIDVEQFRRSSPAPESHTPFRLVTVARLHWVKGIDDLLDAVAVLRRTHDTTLDIIGDGPESEALRFRAVALGLRDAVRFTGSVGPAGVRDALERADAFVLTSLSEGISNAVLEAMALDLPVLSTDVGGMNEVITDGINGLLVPPGDPSALASALRRLIDDEALRQQITVAGAEQVRAHFSLDRQRAEIADLYRRLDHPTD